MGILLSALILQSLSIGISAPYAMDPRFELDPGVLQQNLPRKTATTSPSRVKDKATSPARSGETSYTAQQGDTLTRILVHELGMSRKGARALIPEIKRRNKLGGGGLQAGQRIIIPLQAKKRKRDYHVLAGSGNRGRHIGESGTAAHRLSLFKASPGTASEMIAGARIAWGKLLPGKGLNSTGYSIRGNSFSLDLDPNKFPIFTSASGGKIVVEAGGSLSPFVRSLIEQHDPATRVVACDPGNRKRFFADLLGAAGFYSVEEDFSVSFGNDPKLTVKTDFKVENDSDSPLEHDIYLVNAGRSSTFPPVLGEFLAGNGFKVIETSPGGYVEDRRAAAAIAVISEREPHALADRLLSALDLAFEKNRVVDLLRMGDEGVGLRVKADRYFEKNGERYVVTVFNGDPESYTLLRLLEATGYHVVMINPDEDFRSVSGKILSQLNISGSYALHDLLLSREIPYSIQMSGIMVKTTGGRGRLFLTETRPDRVVAELLKLNGYTVLESHYEAVSK